MPAIRRARRRAAEILARIMLGPGFDLKLLESISSNSVYLASRGGRKIIIRLGSAGSYYHFRQAAAAMKAAGRKGVPVPDVLLTGRELVPCSYQITEYMEGTPGDTYKGDVLGIWRQIGSAAAHINQVRTTGLEYDLFTKLHSVSWEAFITQKIGELEKFWPTFRHWKSQRREPFFSGDELAAIFRAMEPLKTYRASRRSLIHIDLAPRNVLVDDKGRVAAVLDWDSAKSFPPEHQVGATTFWLTPDEEKAFLKGYRVKYDPRIILGFQLYEYLTQIPYKPIKIANIAHDIMLWRVGLQDHPRSIRRAAAEPTAASVL